MSVQRYTDQRTLPLAIAMLTFIYCVWYPVYKNNCFEKQLDAQLNQDVGEIRLKWSSCQVDVDDNSIWQL